MSEVRNELRKLYDHVMELSDIANDTSNIEERAHRRGMLVQRVIKPHGRVDDIFPEDRVVRMQQVFQEIISISSQRFVSVKGFARFLDFFVEMLYMNMVQKAGQDESYWVETLVRYWSEGMMDR